jgi:hypothetical protein
MSEPESRAGSAEEWTTADVVAYLAGRGRTVKPGTWYGYVSRGQAPRPVRRVGRTPVWEPAAIRAYADRSAPSGDQR